jgi:hypothetical protein
MPRVERANSKDLWGDTRYLGRISNAALGILDNPQTAGSLSSDQSRQVDSALALLAGASNACVIADNQHPNNFNGDTLDQQAKTHIQKAPYSSLSDSEKNDPRLALSKILVFSSAGLRMWRQGFQIEELNSQARRLFTALSDSYSH